MRFKYERITFRENLIINRKKEEILFMLFLLRMSFSKGSMGRIELMKVNEWIGKKVLSEIYYLFMR